MGLEAVVTKVLFYAYLICLAVVTYHQTQVKKINILLPDLVSHSAILIIVTKLIWSPKSTSIELIYGIMMCFIATFMVGIVVGKSMNIQNDVIRQSSSQNDCKIVNDVIVSSEGFDMEELDCNGDNDTNLSVPNQPNEEEIEMIATTRKPSTIDLKGQSVQDIESLGVRTLVSIAGIIESSIYSTDYTSTSWSKVKSDPTMEMWESRSAGDGVLLHATSRIQAPSIILLKWLIDEGFQTGLESIVFRNEIIETVDANHDIRKLYMKTGSMRGKKRVFTLLTSLDKCNDEMVVLSSRSVDLPATVPPVTVGESAAVVGESHCDETTHGFVTGRLYGSGYVIRPVSGSSDTSCDVTFAIHLDMVEEPNATSHSVTTGNSGVSGSGGRMHSMKSKILYKSVNSMFRNLHVTFYPRSAESIADDLAFDQQQQQQLLIDSSLPTPGSPSLSRSLSPRKLVLEDQIKDVIHWRLKKKTSQLRQLHKEQMIHHEVVLNNSSSKADVRASRSSLNMSVSSVSSLGSPVKKVSRRGAMTDDSINSTTSHTQSSQPSHSSESAAAGGAAGGGEDSTGMTPPVEVVYQREGVTVMEHSRADSPVGVLSAYCHINAPPDIVHAAIMCLRSAIDGLLVDKNTLYELNLTTSIQWQAYKIPFPMGKRDFLLVSGQEPLILPKDASQKVTLSLSASVDMNMNRNGFVLAWSSVDDICEDLDGLQECLERVAARANVNLLDYTRTNLRIGGYACAPSADGGSDVSLFFDADIWSNLPPWLLPVLAQVVVFDMMIELKKSAINLQNPSSGIASSATATTASSAASVGSQIDRILQQVERREKRMKAEFSQDEIEWDRMIRKITIDNAATSAATSSAAVASIADAALNMSLNLSPSLSGSDTPGSRIQTQQQQQQTTHTAALNGNANGAAVHSRDNDNKNGNGNNLTLLVPATTATGMASKSSPRKRSVGSPTSISKLNSSSLSPSSPSSSSSSSIISPLPAVSEESSATSHQPVDALHQSESTPSSPTRQTAAAAVALASLTPVTPVGSPTKNKLSPKTSPTTKLTNAAALKQSKDTSDVSDFSRDSFKRMFRYMGMDKASAADTGRVSLGLNWERKIEKDGIEVYATLVNGSQWSAIRGTTYVNADKEVVKALLLNDARMCEYDDMFDFSKHLLNIDERTRVRRLAFKPIWPTSPRDFIVGTTWTELKNGSLLIVSRSVPNVMGEEQGYVRGFVQISGFLIQPVETPTPATVSTTAVSTAAVPTGRCKVTLCAHTELGGTLPSSIVNMLSTGAPLKILDSIRSIVKTTKK